MRRDLHLVAFALVASLTVAAPSRAALVYQAPGQRVIAALDDGTEAHTLARGSGPVVSPDGRWVAYMTRDQHRVMLKSITGGRGVIIARGARDPTEGDFTRTAWSRDSRWVATTAVGKRLIVYDRWTRRSSVRRVFDVPEVVQPAFSPSGRSVAYITMLDVSGIVGWTTTAGARHSTTLKRMGTDPVWGPRGIAIWEFDGSRYFMDLPSFVFVASTTRRHGHRLPGSEACRPVAFIGADVLLSACADAARRLHPVLLGIDRQPIALAPGPFDRIVSLSRDHQSILAVDGGSILRVDLATGARQLLGSGTAPTWSA